MMTHANKRYTSRNNTTLESKNINAFFTCYLLVPRFFSPSPSTLEKKGGTGCSVRKRRRAEELQGFARGKEASRGRGGRAAARPPTPHQGETNHVVNPLSVRLHFGRLSYGWPSRSVTYPDVITEESSLFPSVTPSNHTLYRDSYSPKYLCFKYFQRMIQGGYLASRSRGLGLSG